MPVLLSLQAAPISEIANIASARDTCISILLRQPIADDTAQRLGEPTRPSLQTAEGHWTTICPTMPKSLCGMQWYGNTPAVGKRREKRAPGISRGESQIPVASDVVV